MQMLETTPEDKMLSDISLSDNQRVWRDPNAKTLAFFCRSLPVKIDARLTRELRSISEDNNGANVRLCLHDSPESTFHDMIILERAGRYYRPHKHLQKGETWHILEGTMAVFVFDTDGSLIEANTISDGEIYRLSLDTFHALIPISDIIIYHESKPGPFLGQIDSLYPDWAPDGSDPAETTAFIDKLRQSLPENDAPQRDGKET